MGETTVITMKLLVLWRKMKKNDEKRKKTKKNGEKYAMESYFIEKRSFFKNWKCVFGEFYQKTAKNAIL
jgi:hypothetical protein